MCFLHLFREPAAAADSSVLLQVESFPTQVPPWHAICPCRQTNLFALHGRSKSKHLQAISRASLVLLHKVLWRLQIHSFCSKGVCFPQEKRMHMNTCLQDNANDLNACKQPVARSSKSGSLRPAGTGSRSGMTVLQLRFITNAWQWHVTIKRCFMFQPLSTKILMFIWHKFQPQVRSKQNPVNKGRVFRECKSPAGFWAEVLNSNHVVGRLLLERLWAKTFSSYHTKL